MKREKPMTDEKRLRELREEQRILELHINPEVRRIAKEYGGVIDELLAARETIARLTTPINDAEVPSILGVLIGIRDHAGSMDAATIRHWSERAFHVIEHLHKELERCRGALEQFIYETTHLSPKEAD